MDKNFVYFILIFLGFCIPSLIYFKKNKTNEFMRKEDIISSFVIFLLFFLFFAKIGNIILENNYDVAINDKINVFVRYMKYILSGYSFICGYVGSILFIIIYSKFNKINSSKLLDMYAPVLTLMYGILKIGCFIKGCCGSHYINGIQLVESVLSIILYFIINKCNKIKNKGPIFLIGYGTMRIIVSVLRIHTFDYTFVLVEIMSIFIICYGLYNYKIKKNF